MTYTDPVTGEKYIPYCIEPSVGVDRLMLAFLVDAYDEEEVEGETRVVLRLHPAIAPVKVAVFPLSKKLNEAAYKIYLDLKKKFPAEYDESGSIGRRYRRQDEIGTPFCVTYDFDSENDHKVTIRDRDTMEQIRIDIDQVDKYLEEKLKF